MYYHVNQLDSNAVGYEYFFLY